MTAGEIVLTAFMTFWSAAIIALVWSTYRRLEHRFDRLEQRMDDQFGRVDDRFGRVDVQVGSLRADLTQIALALGAGNPPRASEG